MSYIFFEIAGLILGLHPTNERWRYFVMTSLIGWTQALPILPYCQLDPKEHFSEILFEIQKFLFKEMHLKMSSGKVAPSCPALIC